MSSSKDDESIDGEGNWESIAVEGDAYPPIDFNTFVLSLSTSVLMHLGEMAEPSGKASSENLALARQTIDLLALLEEKTRGNLTGEEERLLTQMLFDLRMRFVKHAQRG